MQTEEPSGFGLLTTYLWPDGIDDFLAGEHRKTFAGVTLLYRSVDQRSKFPA
jgi:hypothetical protein